MHDLDAYLHSQLLLAVSLTALIYGCVSRVPCAAYLYLHRRRLSPSLLLYWHHTLLSSSRFSYLPLIHKLPSSDLSSKCSFADPLESQAIMKSLMQKKIVRKPPNGKFPIHRLQVRRRDMIFKVEEAVCGCENQGVVEKVVEVGSRSIRSFVQSDIDPLFRGFHCVSKL